jgi:N-acetylmuramic acid 6-phosphate etherase
VYVGAGSSGALAALDAAECGPTFGSPPGEVVAVVAEGEAAEDDRAAATTALLELSIGPEDCVVAISASGSTPFVLAALETARQAGSLTVAVTANYGSAVGVLAEHGVTTVVGPEVITGSTRLKAGTAHKLVLNTISTVVMIRLGRTYGGLMVGLTPANDKLRERARRNVALASGASEARVDEAIAAADGDARVALVSLLAGLDADSARARLEAADGSVRKAVSQ